jgi:type II secretory pathway pseudopilin PulG
MRKHQLHKDQRGLVAIVVVSIIIIILAILTLGFSKIMDRELRQSLDRELAMQANYAAEAGINDARVYISKALAQNQDPSSNNCAPPTGISPSPFVGSISGNFNSDATDNLVKYSCVIIDSKPRQLIWDLSNGQSTVFKMTPDKTLSTLYVSWENALYQLDSTNTVNPLPLPGDTANLKLPKEDQFGPNSTGMARVTVYPITNGLPPNPDDDLAKASNTFFMYSSGGGVASSTGDLASASYRSKGAIIGGRCNSANRTNTRYLPFTQARAYYCNAAITGLPPAPAYYVRVTSIYKPVSVAIQGQAAADGSSARLGDAEAMIDVTGEGNDVLKRQQVRVPYTPNYDYPSYAVQSMDTLCKRFRVPQVTASSVGDAFADPTVQNLQYCNFAGSSSSAPSGTAPTCNLSLSATTISSGGSTTLTWSYSGNVTSATISPNIGVPIGPSGSKLVSPSSDTTYILTVTGPGGTCQKTATVNVNNSPPPPNCKEVTISIGHTLSDALYDSGPHVHRANINPTLNANCNYRLEVVSWDEGHPGEPLDTQPQERIFLELCSNSGGCVQSQSGVSPNPVWRSGLTPDIPNLVTSVTTIFTTGPLPRNAQYVLFKHSSIWPGGAPQPYCGINLALGTTDCQNSVHGVDLDIIPIP